MADDLMPEFREWLEKTSTRPYDASATMGYWSWDMFPREPYQLPEALYALLEDPNATYDTKEQAMLDLQQAWLKWRQTVTTT